MAEDPNEVAIKAELEAGRAAREQSLKEFGERTKGKPTPTQAENDEAAAGKSFVGIEHEADGSDLDQTRQLSARPGGGYTTRQATASGSKTVSPPAGGSKAT